MTNHQNRGVISIESGLKGQILVITLTERTNDIFHTYLMEMKYSQPEICFNLYSFVETLLTHFLTSICATFLSHTKCKTKKDGLSIFLKTSGLKGVNALRPYTLDCLVHHFAHVSTLPLCKYGSQAREYDYLAHRQEFDELDGDG